MKKSCFTELDKHLKILLKKGVDDGVFSGAVGGVYQNLRNRKNKLVVYQGKTRNDNHAKPVLDTTLFDLASLTKPLCTVLSILNLINTNKISLDASIDTIFGTKTGLFLKNIKIANLLSHSSGFKNYEPYFKFFKPEQNEENKNKLIKTILNEKPVYKTGEKYIYSDFGYIILGEIIEKITGQELNDFYTSTITLPLQLEKKIMFRPDIAISQSIKKEIAATQYCPWRKRLLQGEVDDEHCWLMNGVAGHAGLFGSVHGVLDMCIHILNQWKEREKNPAYSNKLLQKTLTRISSKSSWCMGFDTPSPEGSSGGKYLSKKSVGHLGFTGTSFWIDPENEIIIVLLTNRIHPTRDNDKLKKFRPMFHDTVFEILQKN